MTEFELIELIYTTGTIIGDTAMNIATIFFAYVVAAYLAGGKLSNSLAAMLSTIYSVFLLASFFTIWGAASNYNLYRKEYMEEFPDGVLIPDLSNFDLGDTMVVILSLFPALLAWVLSIIYMHFIARKGGEYVNRTRSANT